MMKQIWSANELWSIEVESHATRRVSVYIGSHDHSSMIRMPRDVALALFDALTDAVINQITDVTNVPRDGGHVPASQDGSPTAAAIVAAGETLPGV